MRTVCTSGLLLLLLLLLGLPSTAEAQFAFTTNNGVLTITGYSGPGGAVTIPGMTNGLVVSGINAYAFSYSTGLTRLTIGASVTDIGIYAFGRCTSLTNVIFPSSVTSIGGAAFSECYSLGSVLFMGNAPYAGKVKGYGKMGPVSVFTGDLNAAVYYVPGSTGWGSTFGDATAQVWNPLAKTPSVQSNELGVDIIGTTNAPILIEAATNVAGGAWVPLQAGTLTNGLLHFTDPQWTNYGSRFYRVTWP